MGSIEQNKRELVVGKAISRDSSAITGHFWRDFIRESADREPLSLCPPANNIDGRGRRGFAGCIIDARALESASSILMYLLGKPSIKAPTRNTGIAEMESGSVRTAFSYSRIEPR